MAPCHRSVQPSKLSYQSGVIKQSYQTANLLYSKSFSLAISGTITSTKMTITIIERAERQREKVQLGGSEGPA